MLVAIDHSGHVFGVGKTEADARADTDGRKPGFGVLMKILPASENLLTEVSAGRNPQAKVVNGIAYGLDEVTP